MLCGVLEVGRGKCVLPKWWNTEKKEECVKRVSEMSGRGSIHVPIQKSDVREHYKDDIMPMRLRVLAK